MLEIASQITICLLIAAVIGFIIGFIVAKSVYMAPTTEEAKPSENTESKEKKQAKADTKAKVAEEKAQAKVEKEAAKKKADAEAKAAKEKDQAEAEIAAKEKAQAKAEKDAAKKKADAEAKAAKEKDQAEAGVKPELLDTARNGEKDDLTQIKGIGPKVADQLNEAGVYHLDQIAGWTEANIKWLEINTTFAHRATKDLWVSQAKSFK